MRRQPSEALKKFTEDVKKDPIGAILDTEAKWASVATGIPLPITEGVMEAVEDTVKGIIGLPSTIAEISKAVVTEVRENPIGVAKTYLYYAYNPKAKVEVTMAIGGAIRDSVINVRDEIANAATPDDKLRLISKLLTEIGICFIPVGGVVSKTGKMTVGAKSGSFMSNFIARLKPNWLGNRKPVIVKYHVGILDAVADARIVKKVQDFRNKLPHKLKKSGNAAYADVRVEGIAKTDFYAHSGIDELSVTLKDRMPDISVKPEKPMFEAIYAPNELGVSFLRDSDTEYKILNNVATHLGKNTNAKGKILLFTEKKPCYSCDRVIKNFTNKYKNIEVEVIHNNGERLIP